VKDKKEVVCSRCKSTDDKIKYAFLFSFLVEDDGEHFLPIIIYEIEKVNLNYIYLYYMNGKYLLVILLLIIIYIYIFFFFYFILLMKLFITY